MSPSTFLELAAARRSIRKYTAAPVEREKLDRCLEAARLAPSACNAQPYRFVVLDEPAVKEKFSAAVFSGVYSACKFAAGAPVLVAVVSDTGKLTAWLGNQMQDTNFRLVDIGIAAEHFVLAAAEQGLGTCWLGWFDAKAAAKTLGLGAGKKVEVLLSVGYPGESPAPRPRKPAQEFASFNKAL
ncbi:MAG TPA: nitroreductase family protein [Elusimicrobiales bacterium]|nr:nitroreductase family protein [Elusimicrobiales bacterium]